MNKLKRNTRSTYFHSILLFFVVCSIYLVGCSSSETTEEEEFSGFLSDYSQLEKGRSLDGQAVVLKWVSPMLPFRQYTKVMIDPVVIYPTPQPGPQLRAEVLKSMLAYINKAVEQEVSRDYEVVTQPGPDVVRLRSAITGVKTKAEDLEAYEYIPIAFALASVQTATGTRDEVVEIFLEAELLDSSTSERLAAAVKKGFGKPVESSSDQVELENVRPVLDGWARSAVTLLDTTIKK